METMQQHYEISIHALREEGDGHLPSKNAT